MGLFDIFKKKSQEKPAEANPIEISQEAAAANATAKGQNHISNGAANIDTVYSFLQFDYESRGYNDALTNPDDSYRNDNINLLKQDLFILLDKSLTYYEGLHREVDFHINSRTRAGLIDLVEELKTRKDLVSDHLTKIRNIKADAVSGNGAMQRITLSYQRGFMRGLSALTQSNVFNKKL